MVKMFKEHLPTISKHITNYGQKSVIPFHQQQQQLAAPAQNIRELAAGEEDRFLNANDDDEMPAEVSEHGEESMDQHPIAQ